MLPVETFADVVFFLGYYDLAGLKLASKLFSVVANECADAIRLFDFVDFSFYIYNAWINVYRFDSGGLQQWVCKLELSSETNLAEFVSKAFRNCKLRNFGLMATSEIVLKAMKGVANTVTVVELHVPDELAENVQELIEFAGSFRRVEVLLVSQWEKTLDIRLKTFCGRKNIGLFF